MAALAVGGTVLPLPAHAAPALHPSPVRTSTSTIPMGSVAAPAPGAQVGAGTGAAAAEDWGTPPMLSVSRTGTEEFSLVGVTWAYDAAVTGTVVRMRALSVAGTWDEWSEVPVEDPGRQAAATAGTHIRGGTEPVWTGPSAGIEAEVVTRSGARPSDVRLDLVDPGSSAADSVVGASELQGAQELQSAPEASLAAPEVQSRAD